MPLVPAVHRASGTPSVRADGGTALDFAAAVVPFRSYSSLCRFEQSAGGTSAITTHACIDGDGPDGAAPAGIDHITATARVDLACAAAGGSPDRVGAVDSPLALGPAARRPDVAMVADVVAPGLPALGVAVPAALALALALGTVVPDRGGRTSG